MDAISFNYRLTKFVMEVDKDSGERYQPRTVYGIVRGVKRHLGDKIATRLMTKGTGN